jgi:hypothetical protein
MLLRDRPSTGFYLAAAPSLLLAARLLWENTVLSWERGPQMIGWALVHTVGLVLFPAVLLSLIWALSTVVVPVFTGRWRLGNLLGAAAIVSSLGLASLPYGFWVKAFAGRIAAGPHAVEFLVHMAALGELSAVQALLDRGVPINESNRDGLRAIEAAENAKQIEVRAYLASRDGTDKRF